MKAKYGKYYLLDNTKYYRCVDLQRDVKFTGKLAVKCDSEIGEGLHFGTLINTSEIYDDLETNNEIVFGDENIIDNYELSKAPLIYMDFPFNGNEQPNLLIKNYEKHKSIINN